MARIHRGTRSYKRGNARNFTQKEAQARLEETVAPFNKQVENALFVNAVEIDYYQALTKVGRPCTCEKIEMQEEFKSDLSSDQDDTTITPIVPTRDNVSSGTDIRLQDDDLFGDSSAEKMYGTTVTDVSNKDIYDDDDIPSQLYEETQIKENDSQYEETTMFGSNANCGICYRTGFQPGYKSYSKQRFLLTTWDIDNIGGYNIISSDCPNSFNRQGPIKEHTFVEFVINVPKYFINCLYSVRDDTRILLDKLSVDGHNLTKATLQRYAGRPMRIKITAERFTHIVLEFDIGVEKIRANIGAESQSLDYAKLEALSNFPVVLPPSIHEVNTSDIIVIKDRRLVLKVLDKERKITADKRQLEWTVQTRVVQKMEPLRNIAKGYKIL